MFGPRQCMSRSQARLARGAGAGAGAGMGAASGAGAAGPQPQVRFVGALHFVSAVFSWQVQDEHGDS